MVKLKKRERHGHISFESGPPGLFDGILVGSRSMVVSITGYETTYFSTDNTESILIHQVFKGKEVLISRKKDYQS